MRRSILFLTLLNLFLFLFSSGSLVLGQLQSVESVVIDDGTTGEGLSRLTSLHYQGSIDPHGDGTLLVRTSQGAKIVWYDGNSQLPSGYKVSCRVKPEIGEASRRLGLVGWLDTKAKSGITAFIKPGAGLMLRYLDFTASGNPEKSQHLWEQGGKKWSDSFYTDLPVPQLKNHRCGYFGSYAAKTKSLQNVGWVDDLTLGLNPGTGTESESEPAEKSPDKKPVIIPQVATAIFKTAWYRVEVVEKPFGFSVIESSSGNVLLHHYETEVFVEGRAYLLTGASNVKKSETSYRADFGMKDSSDTAQVTLTVLPNQLLKIDVVSNNKKTAHIRESFLDQGEEYYGVWEYSFGGKLSNRGVEYDLIGVTPGAHGMHSTNARAPFYMTSRKYGIYVDTLRLGRYAFAKQGKTRFGFHDSSLSWYFIYGPSYADLMHKHNQLAGAAFVPPDWALGTAWWRDDDHKFLGEYDKVAKRQITSTEENIEATANHLQYYKIPASVIWIDRPYGSIQGTGGSTKGWGNMDFNTSEKAFPNYQKMIDRIRGQGYEMQLWIANRCNGVLKSEAKSKGYIFTHNDLTDPAADMRIPAAYDWFQNYLDTYAKMGIKGYKIDRGHPQAETPAALENENVYLFTKMAGEGQRNRHGSDSFVFGRNAFDKSRAYIGIWNGDVGSHYKGLQDSIRDTLRCGAINFPIFGSDTPGLAGGRPSADLFARWVQFSTYCTWMEINIGNTGLDRTIWYKHLYPSWLLDSVRKQCQDHHDLIPYTRSCLYQATQSGMPVTRALIFEYPDEKRFYNTWDTYLYGPSILVAPVTSADVTSRKVNLPDGNWLDYNDKSTAYSGGCTINVAAPKDLIPLFVKEGAIIPRGDVLKANNNWTPKWSTKLRIECFPSRGVTEAFAYYDHAKVVPLKLSTTHDGTTQIQFSDPGHPGVVEVFCKGFNSVIKNGKSLQMGVGMRWDKKKRKLTISYSGATKITIEGVTGLF